MAAPTPPAVSIRAIPVGDDTEQRLLYKICAALTTGLGLGGVQWISDTATHSGDFWIFHAVTDSTIAAIAYAPGTNTGAPPIGTIIKAGDRIYGNITLLQLSSGTGELYRPTI